MKQPYNTTIYNTALYLRLSRDDELQGESGSIQTQRMMLRQYAAEHGLTVVDEYIDDAAIIGLNQKTLNLRGLPIKSYFFTLFTHSHLPRGEILSKKP